MPTPLAPLQHLLATDPLATLFNDWLTGLRPVQEFARKRPGKPDAEDELTRQQLQQATVILHGLHRNIVKAHKLLTGGALLTKLKPLFRNDELGTCIGARAAENLEPLLFYVGQQASITSRKDYKRLLRYGRAHKQRLIDCAVYPPALDRVVGLMLAVFDAAEEVSDFYHHQTHGELGRIRLLGDMDGILNLDFQRVPAFD